MCPAVSVFTSSDLDALLYDMHAPLASSLPSQAVTVRETSVEQTRLTCVALQAHCDVLSKQTGSRSAVRSAKTNGFPCHLLGLTRLGERASRNQQRCPRALTQ